MPRNASGIYTLPGGNPVTPGDVIEADWANTTLEDVADALTNSLSRTGAGGMLAPFRIADGNISGPGLSYLNETNTGLYRSGSGSTWMAVLGVNVAQFSTVGLTVAAGKALTVLGNASASGTLSITGATTLASTLAVTGAITATGGVVGNVTGNVTAASGTSTFNDVVVTGALDMTAGSSATITGLSTPTNASDAANKGYVDTQDALRLALTGGTMSGAIAMGSSKITGLATPTADADAATKAYVDSVAQGLDVKGSCRVATVANISLSGTQTIDGVAVIAGDRVLVKDQSTAANNGIYVVAAGSWARAADADTWAELVGAFTFVEEGTVNDNSGWVCTSPAGGTLGVTAVTWEQFSGAGQITAGAGLFKSGNTLNVGTASSARIVVGTDDIDLATTGVTASTYKSVTVDAYGRVTGGTNPTTLAGYGITDAYTQAQVDAALALKLNLTGGTMSGAIAMGTNKITGLGDPTLAQDAATKNYIDTIFGSTTTAAASAAAAAASASAASSSATSASGSASAASASASAAAASFDSFDDRYLGAKSSDPSTDNDGNALLTGALYWNTTSNQMRVYTGSAWEAAYLPASGYAALASANVFTANQTITDNSSNAALSITQAGSGNALYIEDVAADATPFVVSSTGAVGIGTTTPDNVTSAGIALVSSNGYYPQVVNRNKTNDANASYFVFDKDRAGAVVQSGDALGAIVWRSFDGANYLQSSAIIGYSDGTPGTNDVPGRLTFLTTADGASSPTERLRIANTGAWGLAGANYGTAGQVLTSNGSGSAPTWQAGGGGGGSAATPTALGTVYGSMTTSGGSPYLTAIGYNAGVSNTSGTFNTAVAREALALNTTGIHNTAVGHTSLYPNTSGSYNTSVGSDALRQNTTASNNTAVGYQSLYGNVTGANNTAVGYQAAYGNSTGGPITALGFRAGRSYSASDSWGSVFIGNDAGYSVTSGIDNVAIGGASLATLTYNSFCTAVGAKALRLNTANRNSAFGWGALSNNSSGGNNNAFGVSALSSTTTGGDNTAFGSEDGATGWGPLHQNTTGAYNVAIGNAALRSNTTSSNNTAVGWKSLALTTGGSNTGIGYIAGSAITSGGHNACLGAYAGQSITTANHNIAIGYDAGLNHTTGNQNIFLGRETRGSTANASQQFVIGYNVIGQADDTITIGDSGGKIYNSYKVNATWTQTSDGRLKKNIQADSLGLSFINRLRAVTYEWKPSNELEQDNPYYAEVNNRTTGVVMHGLIAQEVKAALDAEGVNTFAGWDVGSDGIQSISREMFISPLIKAVQELTAQVETLKAEVAALKGN